MTFVNSTKTPSDGTCLGEPPVRFLRCWLLFIVFVMLVVALHSLLFDVISRLSVSHRRVLTPILYFQPSSSQSDSWHFHFNLSGPFFHSFTASATVLSGHFLPIGVFFYLTLVPHIFDTTCFCIKASLGGGSYSLRFTGLHADLRNTDPAICLFDSQQSTILIFRKICFEVLQNIIMNYLW